jgi:hypothetical protein
VKPLRLYWSSSLKDGRKNFGDALSPWLVSELSGREVVHASPNAADLVAVGSILQRVKHHWWNRRVHIWGSGFIAAQHPVSAHHHYHAVRGAGTQALVRGAGITALGDPGLLVDRLLPGYAAITKRYAIGVVPHYKDRGDPALQAYLARVPHSVVIDILSEPMDFLRQLAACEFVLSSSLHGLIVADAFRIPNAWIVLSGAVRGDRFKFHDYYSAFGIAAPVAHSLEALDPAVIDTLSTSYRRDNLDEIQHRLLSTFPFTR